MKKHVAIASKNPAKIQSVEDAFQQVFPDVQFKFDGYDVESGVASQPLSEQETQKGSRTRVRNLMQLIQSVDYYVAIEAGIEKNFTFAWISICDRSGVWGESRSSSLMLPQSVLQGIKQGAELGDVMDAIANTTNVKQKQGAMGVLTKNHLTRSQVYKQSLILALVPFLNPSERFDLC